MVAKKAIWYLCVVVTFCQEDMNTAREVSGKCRKRQGILKKPVALNPDSYFAVLVTIGVSNITQITIYDME